MKTKKLIELLMKEDPTGEGEVCVPTSEGNVDIFCLEWKDGYWDGPYQVLERNWDSPYYNVTGAQFRNDGSKLCIRPMGVYDALTNDPDLPVKIVDQMLKKSLADMVSAWRQEIRQTKSDLEGDMFIQVVKKLKEGHKIIQSKKDPIGKFFVMHWDVIEKDTVGYKNSLCSGECKIVLKSGYFQPVEKEDHIEWEFFL